MSEKLADRKPLDNIPSSRVQELNDSRELLHLPAGALYHVGGEQQLGIAVTEATPQNPEQLHDEEMRQELGGRAIDFINLLAITDEINRNDSSRHRDSLQAQHASDVTGQEVSYITPATPGVETSAPWRRLFKKRLTATQVAFLQGGSLSKTAAAQYATYKQVANPDADIYVRGASMGAASAAPFVKEVIKDGAGERLKGVVLHEIPNYRERSLLGRTYDFMFKSGDPNAAQDNNPEIMQKNREGMVKWLGRLGVSLFANKAYGEAIAKGKFLDDLGDLEELKSNAPNLNVVLANGSESVISPTEDNIDFKRKLESAGMPVTHVVFPEGNHADTMDEQKVAELNEIVLTSHRDS
jgi:hypothetical protein